MLFQFKKYLRKKETEFSASSFLKSGLTIFLDTSVLSGQALEVCELSSSYLTTTYDIDLVDDWGMNRECSLNANTGRDLTDCECSTDPAVVSVNDNTFVHLNTCLGTFLDTNMNLYSVTYLESRDVCTELFSCNLFNQT